MTGFAGPAAPRLCALAARVVLLYWDDAGAEPPTRLAAKCAGTDVPAPVLRLSAPRQAAGTRQFLAFAAPDAVDAPIELTGADGALFTLARQGAEAEPEEQAFLDTAAMLSGLTDAGRVRLVRFLLQSCRTAFGIGADPLYAANMRRVVDELSLRPGAVEPRALLSRHHMVARGTLPATLGSGPVALIVDGDRVEESLLPPAVGGANSAGKGRHALWLALPRRVAGGDARIVVFGAAGIAIRRIAVPATALEPVAAALAADCGDAAGLRDYALDCLAALGDRDAAAAQAAREVIVLASPDGIAIEPDCAIAAGERLFLSGSLRDPHGLIDRIALRIGRWAASIERGAVATFPHGAGAGTTGFAALATGSGPAPASGFVRIALQLRSGATVDSGTCPLLAETADAAAAVLQAVPASAVTDGMVRDILAPALDALAEAAAQLPQAAPETLQFGSPPAGARASVVVPLSADPGILVAWAAALGGRVWDIAAAELIFIPPPGLPLARAEQALAALYRCFGVPSRLVCPPPACGADSFGLGVRAARCDVLVFLGAACLPRERNAVSALLTELARNAYRGVIGGAVLDPSGAIRQAGFAPPRQHSLMSRHAGFPAAVLDHERTRPVFACSSAFLGVSRAVFEAAGGFSAAYCTRDWADADFCLRARASGLAVLFAPRARIVGYGGDRDPRRPRAPLAERLDAWRLARMREREIIEWREEESGAERREAEQRQAAPPDAAVDPRWAA